MAKKTLFNAETIAGSDYGSIVIKKKAVISYATLVPFIQAHGQRMPLSNKGFGLGRDKTNAVIISDPKVSKFHAYIVFKNSSAFINDTDSTNGTWINKKNISNSKAVELKHNDVIVLGDTQIIFKTK